MKNIELFAGAGGLALGLEQAGFDPIRLIEYDPIASQTLQKNRPSWQVITKDISLISCLDLESYFDIPKGKLDLLSGGCPCQPFSYAGKGLGLKDIRGTLFYHYAIFLQKLQPKMFLFENVKGLLTHDHGRTYQTIKTVFETSGYIINQAILNAWDYGVAQKRERLIIVGIRKDLSPDLSFSFPERQGTKLVLKDILLDCPESDGLQYSETKKELFRFIPEGGNWRDLPESMAKEYMKGCWNATGGRTGILKRLSWEEPAPTILTHPAQKQTDRCHPSELRPLTIRESARCQSFPDTWKFCGTILQQYKQIGNAVPVNLAYAIGKQIYQSLEEFYEKNS